MPAQDALAGRVRDLPVTVTRPPTMLSVTSSRLSVEPRSSDRKAEAAFPASLPNRKDKLVAVDKARVDPRRLPIVALAESCADRVAQLAPRPEDQTAEARIDQQRRVWPNVAIDCRRRSLDPMGQIEPGAVEIDVPAAFRPTRRRPADIVVADDEALDLDTLDPLCGPVSSASANLPSSPAAFTSISRSR